MAKGEDMHATQVYIRKDQHEWLKKHPEISLSAFLRKKLDEFIEAYDKLESR